MELVPAVQNTVNPEDIILEIRDGKVWTTSLEIARIYEKEHHNVIQAIKNLDQSEEVIALNFKVNAYTDSRGRKLLMYMMTKKGYRYNKGRAMVGGLIPGEERQTSLLDPYDREKVVSLMQALDQLNAAYGPGTLHYGSQGFRKAGWQMRQNHLSSNNNPGLMTEHQQVKRICELGQSTHLIRVL